MTIVVTGTSGHLGRHAVEALLDRGVPAADVVATARDTARISDLADRGVTTRPADYGDPASLRTAFAGADRLLLVSGSELGRRVGQHTNVVEAAQDAGIGLVAYTSIPRADTSPLQLAVEHRGTEAILAASGLPFVLLRNSWYLENYTSQVDTHLGTGVILGAAGEGRVSAASRRDYAEAAAAVLTSEGHAGQVYELGGDDAFTMTEYAAIVSAVSGKHVDYQDLPADELSTTLVGFGMPEQYAEILADSDTGVARGHLYVDSGDLARLIGRPTTSVEDAVRAALA